MISGRSAAAQHSISLQSATCWAFWQKLVNLSIFSKLRCVTLRFDSVMTIGHCADTSATVAELQQPELMHAHLHLCLSMQL